MRAMWFKINAKAIAMYFKFLSIILFGFAVFSGYMLVHLATDISSDLTLMHYMFAGVVVSLELIFFLASTKAMLAGSNRSIKTLIQVFCFLLISYLWPTLSNEMGVYNADIKTILLLALYIIGVYALYKVHCYYIDLVFPVESETNVENGIGAF